MKHLLQDERGSAAALVAVFLTALLGLAALGTDVGRLYLERQRLSTVADAAALSGAQRLKNSHDEAVAIARDYLRKNNVDPSTADVRVTNEGTRLQVTLSNTVETSFAKVFGIDSALVDGDAVALATNMSGVSGAVPLGVARADWQIGQQVQLKVSPNDGTVAPGNYQALALGRGGASAYEYNLMYGFNDWIYINTWVSTEPGSMAMATVRGIRHRVLQDPTATWQTVNRRSPRLVAVPVLQDWTVNGRGEVLVVGFAAFFVEAVMETGPDKGEVHGRFLRMVMDGAGSDTAPNFGVTITKLVR